VRPDHVSFRESPSDSVGAEVYFLMIIRRSYLPAALSLAIAALTFAANDAGKHDRMPVFQADTSWPHLPNQWELGQTPSVAVDRHDHVWILHRPRTIAEGKKPAPAVIELDAAGRFVNAWG